MNQAIKEIEHHFHNWDRRFGEAKTPSATHFADGMLEGPSLGAFQLTSGNDNWGADVQILGTGDTPTVYYGTGNSTKMRYYDFNRVVFTTTSFAGIFFVRFMFGSSAASARNVGTYSELVVATSGSFRIDSTPMLMGRVAAGTEAWASCLCVGENAKTIDFYFGLHEYYE